jgi:exopolysaccharide production protein ExoZ
MNWVAQRFELSRGLTNLRPMEGIRGFAVFLVFIVHYATLVQGWIDVRSDAQDLITSLHKVGNTGVDLFFILSGYLIYASLITREQNYLAFLRRRVRRIYPVFSVVFLVYLALSFLAPAESKIPPEAPITYLLQNFLLLPGMVDILPMITVAWSLSYEMFYYICMPIIIAAFRLRHRTTEWRIVFVTVMAIGTAYYCASEGGHISLIMFMAGILLHEAVQSPQVRAPGHMTALLALTGGLLATLLPLTGYLKIALIFIAFFVFCLDVFKRPTGWLSAAFSWTPLRWLGNMSYSYYLIHGLALKVAFSVLAARLVHTGYDGSFFWLLLPPMFLVSLVPSTVLFLLIERPMSLAPVKSAPVAAPVNAHMEISTVGHQS